MFVQFRRRFQSDEGITLVEAVVAITLIAFTLTAVLSTAVTSLAAISRNERQVRGAGVANTVLEDLQALPWQHVGLYTGEVGGVTQFEGEDLVLLPDVSPREPLVPQPTETITVDGIDYAVERWITWADDPQTSDPEDYKHFITIVRWQDGGTTRELRSEAFRAPTPDEKLFDALTVELTVLENAANGSDEVTLTTDEANPSSDGRNEQGINVEVTVNDPAATVTVTYVDLAGNTQSVALLPVTGSTVRTGSIVPYGEQFPNGARTFTATATDPSSATATSTRTLTLVRAVDVRMETLTLVHDGGQTPICTLTDDTLASMLTLRVEVWGLTGNDPVTFSFTNSNYSGTGLATFVGATPNGALFELQLNPPPEALSSFTSTTTRITVTADRTSISTPGSDSDFIDVPVYEVGTGC